MKCPCCGGDTFSKPVADMLWSYKDFIVFISKFFTDDYNRIKKYDLDHYFHKVKFTCKELDSWDKILDKMSFYILQDEGSNGKFPPKMAAVVKKDIQAVAFELVEKYQTEIKADCISEAIETVALVKRKFINMPEWNNPNFEFYVERALKYYKIID